MPRRKVDTYRRAYDNLAFTRVRGFGKRSSDMWQCSSCHGRVTRYARNTHHSSDEAMLQGSDQEESASETDVHCGPVYAVRCWISNSPAGR